MGTRYALTNIDYTLPPLPVDLLQGAIDAHLQYRQTTGQAVALYAGRLSWFLRWLRLVHPSGEMSSGPQAMTPADFVEFRLWLTQIRSKRGNKPLGDELQQDILKRLRSALRWGFREGRLAHDYSGWVPAANYGALDPIFLYDDEDVAPSPLWDAMTESPVITGIPVDVVRSWLELFLSSKRLRGLAEATLRDYALRLDYYLAFVANHGLNKVALSTATIELYLMQRRGTVSPFTEQGDFAVLRNFCGWLVKRHYLEASPMLDLERPKKPRKRMRAVSYQQYRDLYLSIKGDDWLAKRDRLILMILFFSGLRANELLKVKVADIEQDGMIYVREGKGDRDRLVPFHPDVPFLVRSYLAVRPPIESEFLLVSSNGSGGVRGVLQYEGLQEMIRRRCRQAKMPHYNLHSFRHGFAIAFLNADMQMSAVSAAMGHTSIDTTQIYARWSGTGLRTAYLAALGRIAVDS